MNLHDKENNTKNKDKIKKVNKSMWDKFLEFKSQNEGNKYRNKIIDPVKRSYNIQKYETITDRKRPWSSQECEKLINAEHAKLSWPLISKNIGRSIYSCKSKMNKLKNDHELKQKNLKKLNISER